MAVTRRPTRDRSIGGLRFANPPYELLSRRLSLSFFSYFHSPLRFVCHPDQGAGGAPTNAPGAAAPGRPAMTLRARHPAGCLPPLAAEGGAPLGAPPWRFSASGPRFRLRHFLRSTCSELLAARVVVPGGRFPNLPRLAVTSRSRGTPRLAPPSGSSLENAPHEPG